MSITISGTGAITGVSTNYSFDKSVSVGGTITYEDVTNVDSVGIITARAGIEVTGGNIHVAGVGATIGVATAYINSINDLGYPSAGPLSNRNLIINGAMNVAQRGTSFSTNNGRNFGVDRFACNASANTTITYSQETDAPVGFSNSLKATITSANSSRQAGDTNYVLHVIEGNNFAHLNFGSANAKTFTLSFYVKSSVTGTYGVGFVNNGSARGRHTTYTIDSADTWEKKTITVPGDTSGTWLTNNGVGFIALWDLGMGTDYESDTIDTWDANADYRQSSNVNLSLTASATWQVTGVQLEVGERATPFEQRKYADELQRCLRYTYVLGSQNPTDNYERFDLGISNATTATRVFIKHPVVMRTAVTVSTPDATQFQVSNTQTGYVASAIARAGSVNGPLQTTIDVAHAGSTTVGNSYILERSNSTTGRITFDAEL